jgi:soluble lytic murein transglycosylase
MIVGGTARRSETRAMKSRWLLAAQLLACLAVKAAGGDAPPAPQVRQESPEAVLAGAAREAAGHPAAAISALQALEGSSIPPAVRRQADLLFGVLLLRQGQREEAIPRLERAAATYPLLADYALWHLAGAYRKAGEFTAAAGSLQRLLDAHPESLFAERASRDLPRDWLQAGDLPRAEEAAGRYLAAFPQGPGRAEVWTTLGEVLLRSGRTDKAEEVWRRVWVELPGSAESQRAKDLLATLPDARPFTPDEQFQRAMTLYQLGRYGQALPELAPFAAPGDPRENPTRLLLGIGSFRLRQYSQAVQWLDPLRSDTSPNRVEAIYWLARGYGRSGDSAKFSEYMTLLLDAAPQTRRAEEGLYLLAQTAADNGETAQARIHLARLLKEYPRGAWTDGALWLQGWLAYKERDLEAARTAWDRLLAEEPGSSLRTPAIYWRGRALEAAKKPREAAEAFRTILRTASEQNYYWFRAKERLGRLGKAGARAAAAAPPSNEKPVAASDTLRLRKARALQKLGLDEEAAEEYSEQVRTHPEDRGGLAETCRAFLNLERYDKAVWLAGQILRPMYVQQSGQPPIPEFWQCLYPRGHWPLVREQATQQGLDPFLVTALIREESAFSPRTVSRAGARGLMQMMPQTAELVARQHNVAPGAATPLEAPEVNVRLGTFHLADLIQENGGNFTLALAAYNAGQQYVRRWQERFGFTDEEEFTEDIPYLETRNYVKKVLGSYQRYSTLYPEKRVENREPGAEKQAGTKSTASGGRGPGKGSD